MKAAEFISSPLGEGKTYSAVGDLYTFLATGEQTGGAYCLAAAQVPPGGGPPPHYHTREEESFFVQEGEITFTVDGKTLTGKPGSFFQVPRGVPHAFKNNGNLPARMLVLCVPAGFENFLSEFGTEVAGPESAPVKPSPGEIQKLLQAAPKYGIHILPPPA